MRGTALIKSKFKGLTNCNLKLIAMIAMAIDHVGAFLMNDNDTMRTIGRLAFPIYAFLIAEGCAHTKNKRKYFLLIFILGLICQVAYVAAMGGLYLGVLLTFSVSILIIYSIQAAMDNHKLAFIPIIAVLLVGALNAYLTVKLKHLDYRFDYGFEGMMMPVIIYMFKSKWGKLFATALCCMFISMRYAPIQWWSLMALIPLLLYNGQYGKAKFKYSFYIFYPAHMLIIYGIYMLIK